jgi:alkyl hydroperoxide reductase subunit F
MPQKNSSHDLIILGAGPAGITAAVYASRKRLDFAVVTLDIGGQAAWSGDIENYTGYQFVTGPELALKFQEHMSSFGIKVNMPEAAQEVAKIGELVRVQTNKSMYLTKTLIIATGKKPRLLNVEGEREFKNKGVTYCATCDGPLYGGKAVAVIGGGNSALDAALQLARISPKIYLVNIAPRLTGDQVMIEKIRALSHVEVINDAKVQKIFGEKFVQGITITQQAGERTLSVEGVFVEVGLIPTSEFSGILDRNEAGEIIVDCHNQTSVEGIFAAGDVTNVPEKQIIIACGEGSKATLSAFRYLSTHTWQ